MGADSTQAVAELANVNWHNSSTETEAYTPKPGDVFGRERSAVTSFTLTTAHLIHGIRLCLKNSQGKWAMGLSALYQGVNVAQLLYRSYLGYKLEKNTSGDEKKHLDGQFASALYYVAPSLLGAVIFTFCASNSSSHLPLYVPHLLNATAGALGLYSGIESTKYEIQNDETNSLALGHYARDGFLGSGNIFSSAYSIIKAITTTDITLKRTFLLEKYDLSQARKNPIYCIGSGSFIAGSLALGAGKLLGDNANNHDYNFSGTAGAITTFLGEGVSYFINQPLGHFISMAGHGLLTYSAVT